MRFLVLTLLFFFCGISASAHEVRPAFLEIIEKAEMEYQVNWKQPVLSGKRLKLDPVFPEGCERGNENRSFVNNSITDQFDLSCDLSTGLITIAGLENTLTDVFVEIQTLDGEVRRELLKPAQPTLDLSTETNATTAQYLWIGVEHIIYGWDHLLFVIGLVLLVNRRQIIGVATSFTIAHSLTLGLAAFGLIAVPIRPVEILIAASIVLLAVEILRKFQGKVGLSAKRPYLIGFLIGLIHGCGFASALSDIGLPKGTELISLLLFNVGVELGQFFIIGVFITLLWALAKSKLNEKRWVEIGTAYMIGTVAMFWFIDRVKDYFV